MLDLLRRHSPWLGLLSLLVVGWLVYWPGLSGGFLFDDTVNLDALGNFGRVDNWRTFWRYITSGTADPTGRPLALLSFLIDARDWPADPHSFLRTNVLLHLLNGGLLFALLRSLDRILGDQPARSAAVALFAAGLWLLHPLLVSTTLYIVQREAMLPATFTLLGLLAYVRGRACFNQSEGQRGCGWMILGIGLATTLAILSKANGILLPLLAAVVEFTILRKAPGHVRAASKLRLQRIQLCLFVLPTVLVFAYVLRPLAVLSSPLGTRPWTIAQRLLSEPRVVLDYLQLLIVPRSVSGGLFNDHFPVSVDVWHPLSTLPAMLLVLGLIMLAFRVRQRLPSVSAALLFYFTGHLLESTTLPLELYFEHRNYLPAMLLFWPLARAVCAWNRPKAIRMGIAVGLLALFAVTTFQRSRLWGHPQQLAELWAKQNPESSRAQTVAAMEELGRGRPDLAAHRLAPLLKQRTDDLQIAFNLVNARCASGGLNASDKQAVSAAVLHSKTGALMMHQWLGNAIEVSTSNGCPGMNLADVEQWVLAAQRNPANSSSASEDIEPLLAQIAIQRQQPQTALIHFDRALAASASPDVAARQAAILASNEYYEQALAHLDTYDRVKRRPRALGLSMSRLHAQVLEWQAYWPSEMALLRAKLHAAIKARDEHG